MVVFGKLANESNERYTIEKDRLDGGQAMRGVIRQLTRSKDEIKERGRRRGFQRCDGVAVAEARCRCV